MEEGEGKMGRGRGRWGRGGEDGEGQEEGAEVQEGPPDLPAQPHPPGTPPRAFAFATQHQTFHRSPRRKGALFHFLRGDPAAQPHERSPPGSQPTFSPFLLQGPDW